MMQDALFYKAFDIPQSNFLYFSYYDCDVNKKPIEFNIIIFLGNLLK